jgi:hypothetical protein
MLEERQEVGDQRLQQLMKAFKQHDTGSGKVSKDDLLVRACTHHSINARPVLHDAVWYAGDSR